MRSFTRLYPQNQELNKNPEFLRVKNFVDGYDRRKGENPEFLRDKNFVDGSDRRKKDFLSKPSEPGWQMWWQSWWQ